MSMICYPFESTITGYDADNNPIYDRAISMSDERYFNKLRYTEGVFTPPADSMQVIANSGLTLSVKTGGAHINGSMCFSDSATAVTLSAANSTYPRIDRIVLRCDDSASVRSVVVAVLEGTPATTPVAPALTRQANYYEIALADVRVNRNATSITDSVITDQRENTDLCGIVVPAIPTPLDLSDLYNQYQASLDEYMAIVASALDGTTAGQIKNMIGTLGNLTTTEKTNTVGAINEVNASASAAESAASTAVSNVGTLANLTTTAKGSAVAAINEVNDAGQDNADLIASMLEASGTIQNGTGAVKCGALSSTETIVCIKNAMTSSLSNGSSRSIGYVPSGYYPTSAITENVRGLDGVTVTLATGGGITVYNNSGSSLSAGTVIGSEFIW